MVRAKPQWLITGNSTANAAKTLTKAADAALCHYVTGLSVFISAAAVGAAADINVILKEDTTAKWAGVIGASAARGSYLKIEFPEPIAFTKNTAANLVVDAGGASVITVNNLQGYSA